MQYEHDKCLPKKYKKNVPYKMITITLKYNKHTTMKGLR